MSLVEVEVEVSDLTIERYEKWCVPLSISDIFHLHITFAQALASDEAEAICKLEKRNFELVELQKKLEEKMEMEREKLKRALDNAKKEGELLKILVNELHREIEGKDDQIKEIGTQLAEARDDIFKLEEANTRLKGQVVVVIVL